MTSTAVNVRAEPRIDGQLVARLKNRSLVRVHSSPDPILQPGQVSGRSGWWVRGSEGWIWGANLRRPDGTAIDAPVPSFPVDPIPPFAPGRELLAPGSINLRAGPGLNTAATPLKAGQKLVVTNDAASSFGRVAGERGYWVSVSLKDDASVKGWVWAKNLVLPDAQFGQGRLTVAYVHGQPEPMAVFPVTSKYALRADSARAMRRLMAAASTAGISIHVNDGFRTFEQQTARLAAYPDRAAIPGYSNHQRGLSVDVDAPPSVFAWLSAHAPAFGFRNDVPDEPWHWTFYGV